MRPSNCPFGCVGTLASAGTELHLMSCRKETAATCRVIRSNASQNRRSISIELSGKPIVNPHFLVGSACIVGKIGTISKNGTALPCHEGGSGTPQQGNDGRIYD